MPDLTSGDKPVPKRDVPNGAAAGDGDHQGGGDGGGGADAHRDLLGQLEHLLGTTANAARSTVGGVLTPAWRQVTQGEPRWPVTLGMLAAVGLQLALPPRLAPHPRLLLPAIELALLAALVLANPGRIDRRAALLRYASIGLIAALSIANSWSAFRLVYGLVQGTEGESAGPLLLTGAAVWFTNVIAFSLWYWELDRGGPVARALALVAHPDFAFVQMQSPELAPADWEPGYVDYLFLSFTNATAFSPTDVMPLTAWAKLTMMAQSGVSLMTVALVVARAVNILK